MNIKTIISIIITIVSLLAIVFLIFFTGNDKSKNEERLILKYLDGNIVLVKNEEIIEKFENVNFEILPSEDKILLESGVLVSSVADAHILIEDYDG